MDISDNVSAIAAVCSVLVAFISTLIAYRAASTAAKIAEESNKLILNIEFNRIFEAISPGRQAMETISQEWIEQGGKKVNEFKKIDESIFIDFYNKNYHKEKYGKPNKDLSINIHKYLHYLNQLWYYLNMNDRTLNDVMMLFNEAILMDEKYINIYMRAHRDAHPGKFFWDKIQTVLKEARNWNPDQKKGN